ncbi:hypothetical protein [Rhodococcus sp. ACT016]|uniref:hypothetical protein n=1 Tax=Rhodococcus sp. ACT016 TaxID=3134808 RepID=UPI003D2709FE
MSKRILIVVTNVGHYDDPSRPTGLWLSELTHAWQVFEQHGFDQDLVAGRKVTGFAWREEVLARVDKIVPYNAEAEMKRRGALYRKAKLPFVSYTVVDGNLVTGQNPGSAAETAKKVVALL